MESLPKFGNQEKSPKCINQSDIKQNDQQFTQKVIKYNKNNANKINENNDSSSQKKQKKLIQNGDFTKWPNNQKLNSPTFDGKNQPLQKSLRRSSLRQNKLMNSNNQDQQYITESQNKNQQIQSSQNNFLNLNDQQQYQQTPILYNSNKQLACQQQQQGMGQNQNQNLDLNVKQKIQQYQSNDQIKDHNIFSQNGVDNKFHLKTNQHNLQNNIQKNGNFNDLQQQMEKRRSRKGIRNNSFILQNSHKNKAVSGPNIKSCQNIDDINNIGNNIKDISKKKQGINNKIGNNSFNDMSSKSEKQSDKNQDLGNVVLESEFFGNYQENSGFKSINIFEESGDNFEELDQKNEFMDTFQSKFDEEQKNINILSLQKFESPQNESGIIEQEKSSQLKGTKRMSKQNLKRKSSLLNFNQEKLVYDYCNYINEEILNQLNNIQMQTNLQDLSLEQEQQQKNILNQFPEMEKKRKIQESNDKIKSKLQFLQIFEEIEGLSVEKQQLKENVQNMSIFQTLQQINEEGKASVIQLEKFSFRNVLKLSFQFFVQKLKDIDNELKKLESTQKIQNFQFNSLDSNDQFDEQEKTIHLSQQKFQNIFAIVEQQYLNSASDKQLLNNKKVNHKNQMELLDFYINELKQIVNQGRKSVKSSTFISKSQTLQDGKQSQLTNFGTIQKDLSNKKNSNLDYYNMRDIEKEEIQKTEANIKKIINSSNNFKFVGLKSNDISPINQLIQDEQQKYSRDKNNNNKKKVNVFSDNVLEYQNGLQKEKDLNNFTFYNSKQKSLNNISAENKEENENNRDKNNNNINKFKVNSYKSTNRISNSCNTNNSNVQSTDSSGKNNNNYNNQNKKYQLQEQNINISNNSSNSKSILSIAEEGQQNYFNQRNGKLRSIPNLGSPINIRKINYQMGQKGNGQNIMRNSLNLKKSAKKILMSNRKNEIKKVNSSDNTDNLSDRENSNKKNKAENDNNLNTQKLEEKYQEDEIFSEKAENVKINQNELYKQIETRDLEFKSYRTNYNFFQTKVSDSEHNSEDNDSENENESENESEKYEKKENQQYPQQQIEIENLQ